MVKLRAQSLVQMILTPDIHAFNQERLRMKGLCARLTGRLRFVLMIFFVLGGVNAAAAAVFEPDSFKIKGKPQITHYTKKQINSNSQFWAMCQDRDGIMYFGNNEGALVFDGERWQKVKLPNNSSIRCLLVSHDGLVYAGGYNEFGTIQKDGYGKYYYRSLISLLRPEDLNFENAWQAHEVQGRIVFRTRRLLIAISENKAITLPASNKFVYSNVVGDKLYVKDANILKQLDLENLELISLNLNFNNEILTLFLPGLSPDDFIAITKQGSVFKVDAGLTTTTLLIRLIEQPSNNLAISAIKASNGKYYVGTLSTQIVSFYPSGGQLIIDRNFPALQDNTVLNLFESSDGNIWALLNDGIDCIQASSPVSSLFESASVYDVFTNGRELLLATNLGVFRSTKPLDKDGDLNFQNIIGLEGQAWSLQQFEGTILCSHDKGLYIIAGTKVTPIIEGTGFWKVIGIEGKPGYYLACSYEGMYLMTYNKARGFSIQHKLEAFNESSRDIIQSDEPGMFWICHGYKGVFKIKIEETFTRVVGLEHFQDKNGLPSPFNINAFRWNDEIVFTTNHGIFIYDPVNDKFVPHTFLTNLFGADLNVRKLLQFKDKTWFVQDDEAGYFNNAHPILEKGMFLQLKGTFNTGLECIYPLTSQSVLIGTNMGLHHFDLTTNPSVRQVKTLISNVSYKDGNEQIACPLKQSENNPYPFREKISTITFNFSAPGARHRTDIQYSFRVDGIDDDWSPWQASAVKEYSVLRPGRYAFHVKAQSLLGEQAEEAVYYFEIVPAWYKSTWAILLYCLIGIFILIVIAIWVRVKIQTERKKTQKEEEQKRRVLELIIQRIKLEHENDEIKKDKGQLELDILHKSKELANHTTMLIKKRELLTDLHEELNSLKDLVKNDPSRQKVRELIRRINVDQRDEEHIRVFETNFERVHHEFFEELKAFFPGLTQKELHLCAFIKMNLGNKEIALIQNITVRGVETARYRIRKKLNLKPEEDMAAFFEKLHSASGSSSQDKTSDDTPKDSIDD
jgi:AraC family transcriptional regulator, chitin signaling transcriptional activator